MSTQWKLTPRRVVEFHLALNQNQIPQMTLQELRELCWAWDNLNRLREQKEAKKAKQSALMSVALGLGGTKL